MQLKRGTTTATTDDRADADRADAERADGKARHATAPERNTDDGNVAVVDEPGHPDRLGHLRDRISNRNRPRDDRAGDDGASRGEAAPVATRTGEGATGRPVVTEEDIKVMTKGQDLGIYRARRRFGGSDLGAALAGLLAAVGMTALFGGIAGAIGTVGYQLDVQRDAETMSVGGFVAGLVVLVLSFLVGGWVAGRAARYDGGRNGLLAALFFVVLSAVMALLGAWFGDRYDVFADIRLPQWFTSQTATAAAVLSAVVAVVVMLAAGWLGGVIGSRYHRRADAYLAEYAQGGRTVTAETLLSDRR